MALRSLYSAVALLAVALSATAQPSWTVRLGGGLGIGLASMPAMTDYANIVTTRSSAERLSEFTSVAELALCGEIRIDEFWSIGLEYSQMVKSFQSDDPSGTQLETELSMPTISLRRTLASEGAILETSFGGGWYSGQLTERIPSIGGNEVYKGNGPGFIIQASAFTPFDDAFYGTIEVNVRWISIGKLIDGAGHTPSSGNTNADLRMFVLGLKFGVFYQF